MLVGLGKALAVIFQGAWLIQVAAVEFEGELGLEGVWFGSGGTSECWLGFCAKCPKT